ncbi:MAG: hypothetical protein IJH04_00210, partial [Eggerthellaceae bacterium]|nr:hypothetical protein [Eggerthellaceae bacterium]
MALAGKSITGAMGLGEVGSQLRLISKTICVVLSFLLVVGAVPVRAFALEGEPDTSAVCTALGAQFEGTNKVANEYDDLNRVYRKTYFAAEGHDPFAAEISHLNWQDEQNRTTSLVRGIEYTYSSGMLSMTDLYYNYDHKGNIVAERVWKPSEDNPLLEKYTYDAKGQLSRCDSSRQNASFTYTYDKAGNIQSVKKYAYTTGTLGTAQQTQSYTYSTGSWGDLLTSYDGHAITYDGAGNIIGYDGATFDWCGRELKEIRKSGHTYHYHYGADGGRTAKVVDGVRTDFLLDSGRIAAQKMGDRIT